LKKIVGGAIGLREPCAMGLSRELIAEHARARRYFYHVDLTGRLYTAETAVRNVATCVKGDRVLAFFFAMLRRNHCTGVMESDYPWVSPCGPELNLVAADDTPIVFADLAPSASDGDARELTFAGGTMREPFDPRALRLCAASGRLYHPLTTHRRLSSATDTPLMLLRSHLVSELERRIGDAPPCEPSADALGDTLAPTSAEPPLSSGLTFEWAGRRFPIWQIDRTGTRPR
jgi:hypothetical protein